MPLIFNLRHLEKHALELQGELPVADLDIEGVDELIHLPGPLKHELILEAFEGGVLVQGRLELPLACECVRCLKPFDYQLVLEDWTCHLALTGEDQAPVHNDCVDLTPYLREDILLSFPRHPLCESGCRGLSQVSLNRFQPSGGVLPEKNNLSPWAELNKLKF